MTHNAASEPFSPPPSFPKRHVVGVIDDLQEAEQAVRALQDAGNDARDIHLFRSQDFPTIFQEAKERWGRVGWMIHLLYTTSDEGFTGDIYVEQARQGHHVLAVYAPTSEQVEEGRAILANHHAHHIKYIGPWAITDFPS